MPRRNPQEKEQSLATLARMFCRGVSQVKMAATLEVSRHQVQKDINVLLCRWGKDEAENTRTKELARICHLEQTYWTAWEESIKRRVRIKKAKRTGDRGSSNLDETWTEHRDGNVEFLRGVQWCIDMRCKILGLIVKKVAHVDSQGNDVTRVPLTEDKKASAIQGLLARLGAGANGANGTHNGN